MDSRVTSNANIPQVDSYNAYVLNNKRFVQKQKQWLIFAQLQHSYS